MEWQDKKRRCTWANPKNERYIHYHDEEWGIPVYDDHKLFEMLVLESFQAGLSWECVLNKREHFRRAFDNFDLECVCAYTEDKILELQQNKDIIRNRLKIRAAIGNAKIFRDVQQEYGTFSEYVWHWTKGRVVYERGETHSQLSDAVSKDLKKRGMKFVGTTIIYSYLQAVGVIYSHDTGCFLEHGKMQYVNHYESPIGGITLGSDGVSLIGLWFDGAKFFCDTISRQPVKKDLPVFELTRRWLDIYFNGKRPDFTPPLLVTGSDFRKKVWEILINIPYGQTITYGDIAQILAGQMGHSTMSAQAVGGAVGHNPISIIIPCHRVIGTNGNLTGYAGGIDKKLALLTLEKADIHRPSSSHPSYHILR